MIEAPRLLLCNQLRSEYLKIGCMYGVLGLELIEGYP